MEFNQLVEVSGSATRRDFPSLPFFSLPVRESFSCYFRRIPPPLSFTITRLFVEKMGDNGLGLRANKLLYEASNPCLLFHTSLRHVKQCSFSLT